MARYFKDQPLSAPGISQKHLLLFYFEDTLKRLYFGFVQTIELLSKDALLHVKNKMVLYIYDMLSKKPEQEQNLLALLVNKLASQTCN
jgi:ribosome biogenesis protein MAK21